MFVFLFLTYFIFYHRLENWDIWCKIMVEVKWNESCSAMSNSLGPHGILQDRILEWVAVPFSSGYPQPRDRTQVSLTAGEFFTSWATRESGIKASSNWQKWGSSIGYTLQIVVLSGDRATKSIPIVQTQSSCQLTPEIAHIPENTVWV